MEITDIVWPQTIIVIMGLVGVGAMVLLALSIALAWRKFHGREKRGTEIEPQPLIVQPAPEYATKEALEILSATIAENKKEAEEGRSKLYDKIEDIRTKLDNKVDEVRVELSEKIENVPSQVIATLRNTVAIGS